MPNAETQIAESTNLPNPKKNGKLDIIKILKLRDAHGLSFADIGRQLGKPRQSIRFAYNRFVQHFPDYQQTELYNENKINYLTQVEYALLQEIMSTDKLKKASLNNIGYVWDKVFNNNRSEQGKSSGGTHVTIQIAYQEAANSAKKLRSNQQVEVRSGTDSNIIDV